MLVCQIASRGRSQLTFHNAHSPPDCNGLMKIWGLRQTVKLTFLPSNLFFKFWRQKYALLICTNILHPLPSNPSVLWMLKMKAAVDASEYKFHIRPRNCECTCMKNSLLSTAEATEPKWPPITQWPKRLTCSSKQNIGYRTEERSGAEWQALWAN